MTPAEKGIFDSIFNTLAESRGSASGTSRGSSARLMSLDDAQRGDGIHGAFGPDVDVQSLRLSGFAARNRVRGKQMTRDRHGSRAAQLREDLAGKISPEDLEAGVDRAKEEMAMCESEPELWDWARREVWGLSSSDAKKKSQASETGASGSSTGAESVDSTAESALESSKALVPEEPKYGVATPFYAPVLHALHVELRDTFRAPLAALAVPRITRGAGLRSFVLGCTSALYAECIRTRWECLGDVHGAAQALREARDAGFVGLSAAGTAGAIGSRTEDEPLREVVERVRTEVRAALLGRLSSSPSSEGEIIDDFLPSLPSSSSSASWAQQQEVKLSTAAQEQLRLVEEMGRIAGKPSRMVPGLLDDDDETFGGGAFGRYDRSPTTRRRSSRESSQSSRPLRERKTDRPVYLKSAYLKYGSSARQPAKRDAKPW